MDWSNVIALIGVLGGFESVKWFLNRRYERRKEDASADNMEIQNLQSIIGILQGEIERLNQRLKERDAKVDALYVELRKEQYEKIEWSRKFYENEIRHGKEKTAQADTDKGETEE